MTAPKHFVAISDETPQSFRALLERAAHWKRAVKSGRVDRIFDATKDRTSPKVLALVFQKPSNRTRVSFEMAMHHFGGKGLYLSPAEIGLGKREAVKDVAAVLGRFVSGIMARVFAHADVVELATHAGVPVVNGLSDLEHPCQAVGDFQTMAESARGLEGATLSYLGDGNNVCHSLMLSAALSGVSFRWIGPKGYEPAESVTTAAKTLGGRIAFSHDIAAAEGSDFLYTDVWASMGQEEEAAMRREIFKPYRLDASVLARAPKARILHCLPAHRGEEITDEVIDGANSVVLDQAENRLYAQMAVLERVL